MYTSVDCASRVTGSSVSLAVEILGKNDNGEGKRRNEFAEWHVAWLAEGHNYGECKIWKMAQRNK